MKIISRFRDYYDHIGKIYGEDSRYVWERKLFDESKFSILSGIFLSDKEGDLEGIAYSYSKSPYEFRWLIVCGKRFLLFRKIVHGQENSWTAYKNSKEIEGDLHISREKRPKWSYFSRKTPEYFMGEFSPKNLDLCVKYKSPIMVIATQGYYTTDSPVLGDIVNFVSLYPAEQIYQDISYFMMNQINGSPDLDPPVVLDDKFKIDYHGFTKESFRPKSRK